MYTTLRDAIRGVKNSLVLITGSSGAGKTRLGAESGLPIYFGDAFGVRINEKWTINWQSLVDTALKDKDANGNAYIEGTADNLVTLGGICKAQKLRLVVLFIRPNNALFRDIQSAKIKSVGNTQPPKWIAHRRELVNSNDTQLDRYFESQRRTLTRFLPGCEMREVINDRKGGNDAVVREGWHEGPHRQNEKPKATLIKNNSKVRYLVVMPSSWQGMPGKSYPSLDGAKRFTDNFIDVNPEYKGLIRIIETVTTKSDENDK